MADTAAFPEVAARLRGILEPYRSSLSVTADGFYLPGQEGTPRGYVAGIRIGKRYVSYYLMPIYAWPSMVDSLSPRLRRRMQGKACFNFTSVDEDLFAELADLTARGIERYRSEGLPQGARPYV